MTNSRKLIVLVIAAALAASPAAPAAAQVFVDPGSPSGKEYEIPLENARQEAATGNSDAPVQLGDRSAPLFGEGVGDDNGGGNTAGSGGLETKGQEQGGSGDRGDKESSGSFGAASQPISATVPQGGFDSIVTIGAVALSVLFLGSVIGSIARRRVQAL